MTPEGFEIFQVIMRRPSNNVVIGDRLYWCEQNKPVKLVGRTGDLNFERMKQQIIDQCSLIANEKVDWKKYAF